MMLAPLPNQAEVDEALAARVVALAKSRTKRFWLSRLIIAMMVAQSCAAMLLEPASLVARVIAQSGQGGLWVVLALLGMSLLAIADVVVSDLLPDRFTMLWVLRQRHLLYMAMALVLAALSIVFGLYAPQSPILWVIYLTHAAFAVAIAWLDLFSRPR